MNPKPIRVFVYKNLHFTHREGKPWYSVQALEGDFKGRVIHRSGHVLLAHAKGVVRPAGRERVRREGKKNVHAGLVGELITLLLAYRSPLCRDTKPMYRPVAEEILKADQVDVLARGFRHDDNMMHGRGEFLVARLRPHSFVESPMCPSLDEIREVVGSTVETALTGNGEMAAP